MSPHAQFSYCQVRLQARYAALPGETDWQRLAGARTLAAYLEEARTGQLQSWVKGFSAQSTGHDLELGLRTLAADLADEAAGWVPAPWRAAVAWGAWLPYLPVLGYLAPGPGGPDPITDRPPHCPRAGAAADLRYRALLDAGAVPDLAARGWAGPLPDADQPARVATRWAEGWRARWPTCDRSCRQDLEALAERVTEHLRAFRQASPGTAWDLRRTLRERLRLDFHRHLLAPVTVFIYLTLVLLDLERLRAELLRRALFPLRQAAADA